MKKQPKQEHPIIEEAPFDLWQFLQRWAPNRIISRVTGWFARRRLPRFIRGFVLEKFVNYTGINMSEADKPLLEYKSVDALFTRRLKPGLRPIQAGWIHPCDGTLTANGRILNNQVFQVKGWNYTLTKLLGEQHYKYEKGYFLTYYLCPRDYHRVHSPVSGDIESIRHLQGQLWPVNKFGVDRIPELFCLNERVVLNYNTAFGDVAMIMVGATNVGDIEIFADPGINTNLPWGAEPYFNRFDTPVKVKAGDEIGAFHLGSTVIVVVNEEYARVIKEMVPRPVKMGELVVNMASELAD